MAASTIQSDVIGSKGAMIYQGIGVRFIAILIDGLIIGLLMGAVGVLTLGAFLGSPNLPAWYNLVSFLIYLGYYTYLEGTRGQTIGKMVMKIKVVREDGGKIDMNAAFTRNILRVVDGFFAYLIGAILILRSPKKQRLGDSVAKTVVIKA
ncbi:MAG TPA: RDD family protein [Methanotrichaceae archaeon]|nr:RDD family protein [Methanotrichaceae archaeon]